MSVRHRNPLIIRQYDADPSAPYQQQAWVKRTGGGTVGSPIGLLLALTYAAANNYTFSYRTLEDTTVTVDLT